MSDVTTELAMEASDKAMEVARLKADNAKLREVIDDITEVVEVSDPALVRFIAKRMSRMGGGRVSREHAHAYEAGYRDGSINYELEHCPACKNVADLQEALAENAKLRELCERCAIELYVNGNVEDAATENLFDDMRELGIEVD